MSLGKKALLKHFFREKSNSGIDANIIKNNGIIYILINGLLFNFLKP